MLSGLFFMLTLWAYAGYVRKPFSAGSLSGGGGAVCAGVDGQADAGHLALRAAASGLLAAGALLPPSDGGRRAGASRAGAARRQSAVGLVVREDSAVGAGGRRRAWRRCWPSAAIKEAAWIPLSARILNALVSYLSYLVQMFCPVGLAPYYPFRANDALLAWQAVGALAGAGGDFGRGGGFAAAAPLPAGRLVLVSGHAGAGDRAGAGGRAGDGRPLYLSAPDRPLPSDRLGGVRPVVPVGSSSLDMRGGGRGRPGRVGGCAPAGKCPIGETA